MPLDMATAKQQARKELAGKNAKARDVEALARKKVQQSYDGPTKTTMYGPKSQHAVEYQHAGPGNELTNYIDTILERGGLRDVQQSKKREANTTPGSGEAPTPTARPTETTEGGGEGTTEVAGGEGQISYPYTTDDTTVNDELAGQVGEPTTDAEAEEALKEASGFGWKELLLGTAGSAAAIAAARYLYKKYRLKGQGIGVGANVGTGDALGDLPVFEGIVDDITNSPEEQDFIRTIRVPNEPDPNNLLEARKTPTGEYDVGTASPESAQKQLAAPSPVDEVIDSQVRQIPGTATQAPVDPARLGYDDPNLAAQRSVETGGVAPSSQPRYPTNPAPAAGEVAAGALAGRTPEINDDMMRAILNEVATRAGSRAVVR